MAAATILFRSRVCMCVIVSMLCLLLVFHFYFWRRDSVSRSVANFQSSIGSLSIRSRHCLHCTAFCCCCCNVCTGLFFLSFSVRLILLLSLRFCEKLAAKIKEHSSESDVSARIADLLEYNPASVFDLIFSCSICLPVWVGIEFLSSTE